MHGTGGGEIVIVSAIHLPEYPALEFRGQGRMRVQAWIMVINPMLEGAAGLLELRPLPRIPHQGVVEHGIVQALQFTPNFAGELESLDLGGGELGFNVLDTMPGGKKSVDCAACHQEQGGTQNP